MRDCISSLKKKKRAEPNELMVWWCMWEFNYRWRQDRVKVPKPHKNLNQVFPRSSFPKVPFSPPLTVSHPGSHPVHKSFSNSGASESLGGLVVTHIGWAPTPELLTPWVWGEAELISHVPRWQCCDSKNHTWRTHVSGSWKFCHNVAAN